MNNPDYSELVAGQRAYFLSGATRPVDWRREQLEALKALLTDNRPRFFETLRSDLRRNDPGIRYPPYSEHQFERATESKLS